MRPTHHYIPCSDTRGGRLVFYPRGIWRWDDATTPRTNRPVRFYLAESRKPSRVVRTYVATAHR